MWYKKISNLTPKGGEAMRDFEGWFDGKIGLLIAFIFIFGFIMVSMPIFLGANSDIVGIISFVSPACSSILSYGLLFFIYSLTRYRFEKRRELYEICRKIILRPEETFEQVIVRATKGARYWTFKKIWKKLRDSHDYGRVFTGIFR